MLSVARSVVSTDSQSAGPLQWQEASADKLPFPDGSFDVVYCQLGLQFFADRAAALREMRRVLGAEGRLALMVWRGIHESPGFAVLAEALERHVGQAAAATMRAIWVVECRRIARPCSRCRFSERCNSTEERDGSLSFD
jgi:ubiquinone/menaquinone biosynthesis C-methylase UbiE